MAMTSPAPVAPFAEPTLHPVAPKVVSLLGKRMEVKGKDFFLDITEAWMDEPLPGPDPMLVPGLIASARPQSICARGADGKSTMVWDLAVKLAYPMPGDQWMGVALPEEGAKVCFMTREETLPVMQRMFARVGGHDRRAAWQAKHGTDIRLRLIHQMQTDKLAVSKGDDVQATDYFKRFHEAMMDWQPGMTVLDTYTKLFAINIDGNTSHAGTTTDMLGEYSATTGSATIIPHHVNKPGASGETKNFDEFRNTIKGSAGFVDGLRNNLGIFRAWSKLAEAAVLHDVAPNRKDLFMFGVAKGNVFGLDHKPRLMRREAEVIDHYTDVTAEFLDRCPIGADLMEGIAPGKVPAGAVEGEKRGRGRPKKGA